MNQKRLASMILLISILVLGGMAGYVVLNQKHSLRTSESDLDSDLTSTRAPTPAPLSTDWTKYHDAQYNFSFNYPSDFTLKIEQPSAQYGTNYPLKVISVESPYASYEDIKLIVDTGTVTKGDAIICLNKEVRIGRRQTPVTKVSCGDAGFQSTTYKLLLDGSSIVLEIRISNSETGEPNVRSIPEDTIKTLLDSFEVSQQ